MDPFNEARLTEKTAGALGTRTTIRQEITMQIQSLEFALKNKKAMLELLNANPAIEKFMDLSRNG